MDTQTGGAAGPDLTWLQSMQRESTRPLLEIVRERQPVVLLDVPYHRNVGDMLILLGTIKALTLANSGEIRPLCYSESYLDPKWYRDDPVIVVQGGGNFNDLYPEHNRLRIKALTRYRNLRTVLLPQSIHFVDTANAGPVAEAMHNHRDLHVYARDEVSLSFLRNEMGWSAGVLAPDMAHALGYIRPTRAPCRSSLSLIRRDIEATEYSGLEPTLDWDDLYGRWERKLYQKPPRMAFSLTRATGFRQWLFSIWLRRCEAVVSRAVDLFSQHETIITSRLHGYILACQMGKASILLDNSYSKNSNYFNTWMRCVGTVAMSVDRLSEVRNGA